MKVRIGFSRADSFISRGIRWFMGSSISHTYLRFKDEFLDTEFIAHADWPGVILVQVDRFMDENVIVEEYEFDTKACKPALIAILKLLGTKFDRLALLGWAWTIAFRRWISIKMDNIADAQNILDNPKKLICVNFCLRWSNLAQITCIPVKSMNPQGLLKYLRENYKELGATQHIFEEKN